MKRIKSIQQLKKERERLHTRQKELAKKISNDWDAILNSLNPVTMLRESLRAEWAGEKNSSAQQKPLRSILMSFGTGILLKKLAGKLWRKRKV